MGKTHLIRFRITNALGFSSIGLSHKYVGISDYLTIMNEQNIKKKKLKFNMESDFFLENFQPYLLNQLDKQNTLQLAPCSTPQNWFGIDALTL